MKETPTKKLPRLLSPRELFEQTGVPRSTWYQLIAQGVVPSVRIASSVRVRESDALRYIERSGAA